MKGKDFIKSKWCERAKTADGESEIKKNFGKWANRVNNTGLLMRAKQLFQFFMSPKITGTQKVLAGGALLYIISPIDLVPDFIPIAGWLDDLGVAAFALKYIFSQMDNLSEIEAAEEVERAKQMSPDEILDGEINGTSETSFTFSTEERASQFSFNVENGGEDLQARLNELKEISDNLHCDIGNSILSNIEARLASMKLKKIAFVGRYSTGKSTLINALLGIDFLPTSPIPTTKAITYVMKGSENALYSEDANGVVTVHESIGNLKNLYDKDIVGATKASLVLKDFPFPDLAITDTPGLEEPDKRISQLTLDAIPEADAVVVLLDAGYLESKREFDFMASLLSNDRDRKLFVVINKIDGKTTSEIADLENRCRSHLAEKGVNNAKIFSMSAKNGNANQGFLNFKDALTDFLRNGISAEAYRHSKSELDSYAEMLLAMCSNAVENAAADRQTQRQNSENARNKIVAVSEEYESQKNAVLRKFSAYRSQFLLDFSNFVGELKATARGKIMQSKLSDLKNTDGIAVALKEQIVSFIDAKIAKLNEEINADISAGVKNIKSTLANQSVSLDVRIRDLSEYSGFFMPTALVLGYFFFGILSSGFLFTLLAVSVGRNFFESSIARALETVGVNRARENVSNEISRELDNVKSRLEEKLNECFDLVAKDLQGSFDNACKAAIAPFSVYADETTFSMDAIDSGRARLMEMVAQ